MISASLLVKACRLALTQLTYYEVNQQTIEYAFSLDQDQKKNNGGGRLKPKSRTTKHTTEISSAIQPWTKI